MKKQFIIVVFQLFLLNSSVLAQDFWEIVNTPPGVVILSMDNNLDGEIFIGANYVTGGGLYSSCDNGASWNLIGFDSVSVGLIEINELGYIYVDAGANGNAISRSTDNGLSWELIYQSIQGGYSMASFPGGLMFASGGTGQYVNIIRSKDYGNTWEEVLTFPSNTEYPFGILIQSVDTIYVGTTNWTGGGGVYRSVDGGNSWEHIGLTDHYVSSLAMNSLGDLFATTRGHFSQYEGGVFLMPKGTDEWIKVKSMELVTSIIINSEDDVYIGCSSLDGYSGGIRCSKDNGQTWEDISLESMTSRDIEGLALNSEEYLFAIEYQSPTPLYRSFNSTITSLPDYFVEDSIFTFNYPNPFSWETTIYYELPINYQKGAQINICNSQGIIVQNIMLPAFWEIGQSIKWCPDELPAGIYFYEISADNYHAVVKMVFSK
jgi:photosystem II stability/assembly factor-like uncharacterized protein